MNKLNSLCEKICEENLSYEEVVKLSESENIKIEDLLKSLKEYVSSPIEMSYFRDINNSNEKSKRKLPFLNPILLENGIKSYYLWESEFDHELMAKTVYSFCCTIGREAGSKLLVQKYNLPLEILLELHDFYKKIVKNEENITTSFVMPSVTDDFFKKLFEIKENKNLKEFTANDYALLIKIIIDNSYSKSQLNYSLLGYLTKNKINLSYYDEIRSIISICFDYIRKQKNEETKDIRNKENIENAESIIEDYISTGLSPEEYHEMFRVTTAKLEKSALIVKESNPILYNMYMETIARITKEREQIIKEKLEVLYNYLANGIEVNGIVRDFTIIDYYAYIDLDFNKLLTYVKVLDNEEMARVIKKFRLYNARYTYSISTIAKRMIETDFAIKMTDGQVKRISMEDKIMTVEYLKSNNVPLNERTIYLAFNLCLEGTLFQNLEEDLQNNMQK